LHAFSHNVHVTLDLLHGDLFFLWQFGKVSAFAGSTLAALQQGCLRKRIEKASLFLDIRREEPTPEPAQALVTTAPRPTLFFACRSACHWSPRLLPGINRMQGKRHPGTTRLPCR
jgi:hypothetical protein